MTSFMSSQRYANKEVLATIRNTREHIQLLRSQLQDKQELIRQDFSDRIILEQLPTCSNFQWQIWQRESTLFVRSKGRKTFSVNFKVLFQYGPPNLFQLPPHPSHHHHHLVCKTGTATDFYLILVYIYYYLALFTWCKILKT